MKTWKAIGLLPLLWLGACNTDNNQNPYGYDYPPRPQSLPDAPTPVPTSAPTLSTASSVPSEADCRSAIQPLSSLQFQASDLIAASADSYHVVSFKVAEMRREGMARSEMRIGMNNPNLRSIYFVKPDLECMRSDDSANEMKGHFNFPLLVNTTPGTQATIMQSTWNIKDGALAENALQTSAQPIYDSTSSSFENYLTAITATGGDVRFYSIDTNHFQLWVTTTESDTHFFSLTTASVIYERNQHSGTPTIPVGIATPTTSATPVPVVTPTPAPLPAGPNRCGVAYSYITIDQKSAFHGTADELFDELNALTASGFCNSISTLGAEYSYITMGGKSAFHFTDAAAGVKALIRLYKAKAGTPETARCGAEYSYITLDGNSSFHFSDFETGVQRLISLIENKTCQP